VSGASLAPKSTVRFEIAAMPPPEPIAPYVTCAYLYFDIHFETSGKTKVLPAPVSELALVRDGEATAKLAPNASTTAAIAVAPKRAFLRVKSVSSLLSWVIHSKDASRRESRGQRLRDRLVTVR
jgi:hypothetical protein